MATTEELQAFDDIHWDIMMRASKIAESNHRNAVRKDDIKQVLQEDFGDQISAEESLKIEATQNATLLNLLRGSLSIIAPVTATPRNTDLNAQKGIRQVAPGANKPHPILAPFLEEAAASVYDIFNTESPDSNAKQNENVNKLQQLYKLKQQNDKKLKHVAAPSFDSGYKKRLEEREQYKSKVKARPAGM